MKELIQVKGNTYYMPGFAKIGVVRTEENKAVLIDSGADENSGRLVLEALTERGWTLDAIYNTHSHADHIGGNAYLQQRTGCRIYAPDLENDFVNHTILETAYFYGGFPPMSLRRKIFFADSSHAEVLTEEVLPKGWEIIPLPGHWFNMVGFRTQDDVVFLADLVLSEKTMKSRSKIPYLVDAGAYLQTLEDAKQLKAAFFVPGHTDPAEDITELLQKNIDKIHEIEASLLRILEQPRTVDEILREVFREYRLFMDLAQYVLIGSTVRSYLAWLEAAGKIRYFAKDNMLYWVCTGKE